MSAIDFDFLLRQPEMRQLGHPQHFFSRDLHGRVASARSGRLNPPSGRRNTLAIRGNLAPLFSMNCAISNSGNWRLEMALGAARQVAVNLVGSGLLGSRERALTMELS
jgi:hypothetical protein